MSNIHGFSFDSNRNKQKKKANSKDESSSVERAKNGALRNFNNNSTDTNSLTKSADSTKNTHLVVADIIKQAREQKEQENSNVPEGKGIGLITLYSNGFIIGHGEFREVLDNAHNQKFLAQLKKQQVPEELEAICRKEFGETIEAVRVHLVDKSSTTFECPPAKEQSAHSSAKISANISCTGTDFKKNINKSTAADIVKQAREQHEQNEQSNGNRNDAEYKDLGLITLYSNGFIIGNGEFRAIAENPHNEQFLAQLKKQQVPEELEAICKKEWGNDVTEVRVNLVDKSSTAYSIPPPKSKFQFDPSKGQSIASSSRGSDANTNSIFSTAKAQKLEFRSGDPSITIQIQFADRRKVKATVNENVTVMQLYSHIMHVSNRNTPNFELQAGYPPKPLNQPSQTVKEAGLLGAD